MTRASSLPDRPSLSPAPPRPGWPELAVGAVAYLLSIVVVRATLPLVDDEVTLGLLGLFVSGTIGLAAFVAAFAIRVRSLAAFGVRRTEPRKILAGAALGLVAYLLGVVVSIIYVSLSGDAQNVQASYQAAAAGGWLPLALALVAGALLTPLGEELFFRGVVAHVLLAKFGAWVGVIASAAVFAVAHGINPVLPVAFVVGVLTALIYRWSGSIWPGVALHTMNNGVALLVPVVVGLTVE